GIPAANLDRIFEPFFTTKVAGKGTGFGLFIARSIIEDHGGRIYARSQVGSGATFIIELPAADHSARLTNASDEELPPPPAIPHNVLIIEDDLSIVKLLQKIVTAEGHRADIAMNGIEALAKLRERSYDLIFCDTKLPQLSSHEMYHEVRQLSDALAQKMVFVTGDVMSDEARGFLERTGSRFIQKPFTCEEIVRLMRSLLPGGGPNGSSHHSGR
ncbi:MAG: response regulator, partial [candidate division WOR-3 bacterium]